MNTLYVKNREEWRKWLEANFQTEKEIWLVCPKKSSGKEVILYNDAVEEALCFGWIDSILKTLDEHHTIQRYSVRNPKSTYSQLNKERITWLHKNNMIHPSVVDSIRFIMEEEYVFPDYIIDEIKKDELAWRNFSSFSDSYKRIRIAYIDMARDNPDDLQKRLTHFLEKTRANKQIKGYGGAEKYY
ncbi:YdeI/OmpD-associated family protein [Dysgonomonas sp. OttesenSCG-928-D17]|nr:YdeI/OmpD-associated family protein [Dysgonomonas sp. OttesenSCG-928-D17]